MPYDKGDFTQQGINGDVSALVRLNEKRVMKVVLSSDDESDNCDISGAVYDLLNGTSYPLGSTTPTGTIAITENTEPGSPLDIAQYRYADVNVSGGGGGDFIGANVTLKTIETIDEYERFIQFQGLIVSSGTGLRGANPRVSTTHNEATYNYLAVIDPDIPQQITIYDEDEALITVELTGNAEFVEEEPDGVQIEISGDCTISVTVHN